MGDLFERAAGGRVSLSSSNICETQQQKQRTEKGAKIHTGAIKDKETHKNTPAVTDGGGPGTKERGQRNAGGWE